MENAKQGIKNEYEEVKEFFTGTETANKETQ